LAVTSVRWEFTSLRRNELTANITGLAATKGGGGITIGGGRYINTRSSPDSVWLWWLTYQSSNFSEASYQGAFPVFPLAN